MTNFDEVDYPGWNDWQHYSVLTVGHAACLLSGVHPLTFAGTGYDGLPASVRSKGHVITDAIQKRELLPRTLYVVRNGNLTCMASDQLPTSDPIAYDTILAFEDFAKWCNEYGYEHPWQDDTHASDERPLSARERRTWLAIIRALSVMAKLPDRGAAGAVEKQLQELGFGSPKVKVIGDVLSEARALEP